MSHQTARTVRDEPFQVWTLTVGDGAVVTATDGDGKTIARQSIPYTDFPLPEITLYYENNTICLPSER